MKKGQDLRQNDVEKDYLYEEKDILCFSKL